MITQLFKANGELTMRKMTEEQKIAYQAKKDRLKKFIEKVAEMEPEELEEIKERAGIITCEGKPLSARNNFLIEDEAEFLGIQVSMVGGFRQWQAQGRQVRKGSKGLSILVPCIGKEKEGEAITDEKGCKIYFKFCSVFDISQTDLIENEIVKLELVENATC